MQLTLGELIAGLEKVDLAAKVIYCFGGYYPTSSFNSYRGYYEQLALGWATYKFDNDAPPELTAHALLELCRSVVGVTFQGWKGGDYTMGLHTPVWVDNVGECNSTMITGVEQEGDYVELLTRIE